MADREHEAFAYLTTPNAAAYRAIMGVFVAAKRRFTVHLRPEDVVQLLPGAWSLDDVTKGLQSLETWGNLRSDPDTSRVTTVEDFRRARFLYQISRRGEAVEQALETYDLALGQRGSLQAVALTDIATQLRALLELATDDEPDVVKVHLLLRLLVDRFVDLADNAQAFMGSLQRSIDLQDADLDAFQAYKDRLIEYLERFIADLVTTGGQIAELIEQLETIGIHPLLDLAARREAQDAAPGGNRDDPLDGNHSGDGDGGDGDHGDRDHGDRDHGDRDGGDGDGGRQDAGEDPREAEFRRGQDRWSERWRGFRDWFVSEPQRPSQARLLRVRARAAIPQLLQVVAALNERRSGRSDRSADFRALALWFAQAPDDAATHQLWRVAFGLHSARHLTVDDDTLDERVRSPVPASTPWADAPALTISPRLRRTGTYERRGKPHAVVDRTAQRQHLAALAEREAQETMAARAALTTSGPVRLSDIGELEPAAFRLFLALLGDALSARRPDVPQVDTTTSDGTMRIVLTELPGSEPAVITTPQGTFRGPDALVQIDDLTAWRAQEVGV